MSLITIIDYGAGNIGSVLNMIRHVGGKAEPSSEPAVVRAAEKIILPGVGSFDHAMTRLTELGLVDPLKSSAEAGIPLLGICLGMQLLADDSEEGTLQGLGLIPGHVRRFCLDGENAKLKIPHMGWNRVEPARRHRLVEGLEEDARFYFVHSYYYDCQANEDVLFETTYGDRFTSGVERGNVTGVQFHPEKSHRYGMQLIRNFLEL
jgi:glutamine amidotransferase